MPQSYGSSPGVDRGIQSSLLSLASDPYGSKKMCTDRCKMNSIQSNPSKFLRKLSIFWDFMYKIVNGLGLGCLAILNLTFEHKMGIPEINCNLVLRCFSVIPLFSQSEVVVTFVVVVHLSICFQSHDCFQAVVRSQGTVMIFTFCLLHKSLCQS